VEQDHPVFAERLSRANDELHAVSSRVLELRSRVDTLEGIDPDAEPVKVLQVGSFTEQEHVSLLLDRRNEARARLAAIAEQFTPNHPGYREAQGEVTEIEVQLRQLATELKGTVEADYEKSARNQELLEGRVTALQQQLTEVKAISSEFRAIQQQVETEWAVHQSLQQRIGETALVSEEATSITTLMSAPIVTHKPDSPNKPVTVFAAAFAGGLLSLGLIGFDLLRGGPFASRQHLERSLRLPVTAEIAISGNGRDKEHLRSEMTKVLLSAQHRQSRFLHLSAVEEDPEGIRIAAYLATASAYYGASTLMISVLPGGDPRSLVNLQPQETNTANLHTLSIPVSFLVAPQNAWQLLGPHCQTFERIIIESTSVSRRSQVPSVLASVADTNLLLVHRNRTTRSDVEEAVGLLSRHGESQLSLILEG